MFKAIYTLLMLISSYKVFSQTLNKDITVAKNFNLELDKTDSTQAVPDGWFVWTAKNEYTYLTDFDIALSGKPSLLITPKKEVLNPGWTCLARKIPAQYIGKEIQLTAYMKLQNVSDFAGLMLRIEDSGGNSIKFANLQEKKINGTRDWELYSVKFPLSEDAQTIFIGPILSGSGKLWINDIRIKIDNKNISEATIKPSYDPNPIRYGNNKANSHRLKINDAELYYEIYGEGEPLLLLHGNSQSIYAFNKQIPELAKRFKVIAVDTRGQGNSKDYSTNPLNYELFADDMKQLLDSLHIKSANVLGWSDGGNTGLIMALKFPALVKRLGIMGAVLFSSKESVDGKILKGLKSAIESLKARIDSHSKTKLRLYTLLLNEPHLSFNALKSLNMPVLVMAGEHDLVLEKHTKAIASNISNSILTIFKDASHFAPVEHPKEFNDVVLRFFQNELTKNDQAY